VFDGVVGVVGTELNGSSIDTANYSFDAQNGHVHDMIGEDGTEYFTDRYHTHMCYTEITDEDTDGDGYAQHEFSPEISYYKTPNLGVSNDRCGVMSSPIEPDAVLGLDIDAIPNSFVLYNNYPNPFNPYTQIRYSLPVSSNVKVVVYNMLGSKVRTLYNGNQDAGYRSVMWNATNDNGDPVAAGMYIYTIEADGYFASIV
jgi:hypothetical protein